MIINEPLSLGGTGAGPSSVQVLLMSLAGCLTVTGHGHVTVSADIPGAAQEEIDAWLEEIENRCPVTANVRADTTVTVTGKRRS